MEVKVLNGCKYNWKHRYILKDECGKNSGKMAYGKCKTFSYWIVMINTAPLLLTDDGQILIRKAYISYYLK